MHKHNTPDLVYAAACHANVGEAVHLKHGVGNAGNGFLDQNEFYRFLVSCDCKAAHLAPLKSHVDRRLLDETSSSQCSLQNA